MLDREEEKEKIREKLRLSRAEGGEGLDQSHGGYLIPEASYYLSYAKRPNPDVFSHSKGI